MNQYGNQQQQQSVYLPVQNNNYNNQYSTQSQPPPPQIFHPINEQPNTNSVFIPPPQTNTQNKNNYTTKSGENR
eukprot:UN08479